MTFRIVSWIVTQIFHFYWAKYFIFLFLYDWCFQSLSCSLSYSSACLHFKKWDFFSFEVLKKKPEEEEPKPEKEPKPEVKPVPTPVEKIRRPEGTREYYQIYLWNYIYFFNPPIK